MMSIKAETSFSLKDDLFNKETLAAFSARIASVCPGFRRARFEKETLQRFGELELKERVNWMVEKLATHLPDEFSKALAILERALPEPLDPDKTDDDFGTFIWIVPGEYVARFGCSEQHLEASLSFLREATKRCSSESAIRPFLNAFPQQTLDFVCTCARDEQYHVRRLASEGIRPLLPWAQRVTLPFAQIVEVLDQLHGDRTRYVTRSVANALNDISKTDADLVMRTLKRWRKAKRQSPAELGWMTRHALRTLLKRDHLPALELLGYPAQPAVTLSQLKCSSKVNVGDSFACSFHLRSQAHQNLFVALRIHFLKSNGALAPKLFIVKKVELADGEGIDLAQEQSFRPMTTRVLYPGLHKAQVVVNGQVFATTEFELVP
jgi:3-methyladenine DNA glycosylase AlkC